MREKTIETTVGLFMLAGILALLVLALKVSGLSNTVGFEGYQVSANFDNIGSLKVRAPVTIAGVRVGQVTQIRLDPTTFKAVVTIKIDKNKNAIPEDSSASILTEGLLGSNYISLTPGFDTAYLKEGDVIDSTHSALILENLIGQFLFSISHKDKDSKSDDGHKK